MQHVDLAIIGTGSGNSLIGPEFDHWSIALVEEGVFGGTCLNRGCIPTKMFVYVADLADGVRRAGRLGLDAHVERVRWTDVRNRVFADRIDPIAADGEAYRAERCPNVTVMRGRGRFTGSHTIAVGDREISAERIVVAAGGRPQLPDVPGLDTVRVHTSDDVMRLDRLPEHLIILGGGFIAAELAHVFGSYGSRITMIQRGPTLLRHEDAELAACFTGMLAERFDLRLGRRVVSVSPLPDSGAGIPSGGGSGAVRVTLDDGSAVDGDALLVATGRIPNSDWVDAAAAGLELHPDGRIVVDAHQRTSVPGIWALGDISSPYQLKHVANHEARVVRHNLAHPDDLVTTDHRFVPHAVFSSPQIGAVGLREQDAIDAGYDVMVARRSFGETAYGWAMEDTRSFCKLVADRASRRLLGAHILGPHAAILVQQLIQGMTFGQTVDEMARGQYYIHPALSEVVENALLAFPPPGV